MSPINSYGYLNLSPASPFTPFKGFSPNGLAQLIKYDRAYTCVIRYLHSNPEATPLQARIAALTWFMVAGGYDYNDSRFHSENLFYDIMESIEDGLIEDITLSQTGFFGRCLVGDDIPSYDSFKGERKGISFYAAMILDTRYFEVESQFTPEALYYVLA